MSITHVHPHNRKTQRVSLATSKEKFKKNTYIYKNSEMHALKSSNFCLKENKKKKKTLK